MTAALLPPLPTTAAAPAAAADYQRTRVERVCARLGLVSLAYLWHQPQAGGLGIILSACRTPQPAASAAASAANPQPEPSFLPALPCPVVQAALLRQMIDAQIDAVLVKVAAAGLTPAKHLGAHLATLPAQART